MLGGILFLLKYFWKHSKAYIIYSSLAQIIDIAVPLTNIILPKFIIDELIGQKRISYLVVFSGSLIAANFVGNMLSNFFHNHSFIKKSYVFIDFQTDLNYKVALADLEQLENKKFLETKENAFKFLYANYRGFAEVLDDAFKIIGKVITFVAIIAIIATLNIFVLILFVVLVLLSSWVDSKAKQNMAKLDMEKTPYERKTSYYSTVLSDFTYGKEIRIGNLIGWLSNKYTSHLKTTAEFYKRSRKHVLKSLQFGSFTNCIQQIATYAYLIRGVLVDSISIGSFTMYVNAVNNFSNAMREVMNRLINIYTFKPYYQALEAFLNLPAKLRTGKQEKLKQSKTYKIEFRNVSFKYAGSDIYSLKNLSIVLEPGMKYSIVGENGAGKTTFVKLLTRMYDPTEGEILINGVNIKDINYNDYMEIFSVIFQDYKLFSMSMKENIALNKSEDACDEDIFEVIRKSGLEGKVQKLRKGMESTIFKNFDDEGFEPSGGEGQKIALARALYKNAPIVILDEPTAALDPRAEYEIYKNFNQLVENKTAIYISHRLSSARFCDTILVFRDGELFELGNHEELINKAGLYKELYSMQAEFYVDIA